MKILATIPVFNPKVERFSNVVQLIKQQCDLLLIYNSPLFDNVKGYEDVKIIQNDENIGIASAFNLACDYAVKNEYDYILFLDQDSIVDQNLISKYREILNTHFIDMLSCQIIENNSDNHPVTSNSSYSFDLFKTELNISAGSLMNIEVYLKIGPFKESLFIDLVDHEYSLRMTKFGLETYITNYTWVEQEFGNTTEPYFMKFLSWAIKITFNKSLVLRRRNYDESRLYYQFRNHLILSKLYPNSIYGKKSFFLKKLILFLLLEVVTYKKLKSIIKGIIDASKIDLSEL
jgi:rhamnosyltransferase